MILTLLSFILLIVFPLGQLGRISFLNQQINVYIYEIVLFVCCVYLIITNGVSPFKKLSNSAYILVLFPIYMILDYVLSVFFYDSRTNIIGVLYLLRLCFYIVICMYFLFAKQKVLLLNLSRLSILLVTTIVFSFAQYFVYPDLRNIMYLGWDPHLYRMVGTFLDPPIAGTIYGIFLFYVLKQKKISLQVKLILVGTLGIMIFLTYSRITYIAFFVTMCLWLLKKRYGKYIVPFVILFILALIFIPKPFGESVNLLRIFSIESRLSNYKEAIEIWRKNPVFGVGYNRLRYVRDGYQNESSHAGASFHSSFLIILATGGIIGLGLFIWLLVYLTTLNELNLYLIVFTSIASVSDNVLLHPFVLFLLFVMMGREK